MNIFKVAGKYLDQPLLVAKFEKKVPYILAGGGVIYTANLARNANKDERKDVFTRTGTTLAFTFLSALLAPKIVNKIFKNPTKNIQEIKTQNTKIVDTFIKENNPKNLDLSILEKAKTKILSFKEIKKLHKTLNTNDDFLNKLITDPENITSKEIFSEIGRLSLLGFIPVVGGIGGGIAGDILTTKNWKDKIPNKVKEGSYQYLANIFLCNVGAGIALTIMENFGVKSKATRAFGMIGGIATTGIIGGSMIANAISNKIINPLFGKNKAKGLYSERKPEALDIGLHTDDIATVAVMSGLKWIEPALPIMYSISGYRAGIGYRNA